MSSHYFFKNKNALVITDSNIDTENIKIEDSNNLTLIFDLQNLSKELIPDKVNNIIHKYKPVNIIIKNSRIEEISSLYSDDKDLKLNELFISDELYSMSGNLDDLFPKFKAKKLTLKKFKINSKLQLEKFLNFINNVDCTELTLDDIFIELLIKKNEKDETYNELDQFISFENGSFYIFKNENREIKTNIKKLKMVDCPLFAITEETFNDIQNYKDISIDIDQISLVNPSMITKFTIKEGYSYICYDLDSYKINEDGKNDYVDCLDDLFKLLVSDNHIYKKLIFKNFDVTKYEYITGENLTYIDEKNWVLDVEERNKKEKFKIFEENLKKDEKKIIKKLSEVKALVFDNCSNYFTELILKFISSSHNNLDLLKIKKCGKDYFFFENIISFNIQNLILFDTPLIVEHPTEDTNNSKSFNLDQYQGNLGNVDNLTIRINCLEHYCLANKLYYTKTIEVLIQLIKHKNFGNNVCFEMNALPIIMTYLVAKQYCVSEEFTIPQYFQFVMPFEEQESQEGRKEKINNGREMRDKFIEKSFRVEGFNNKTIILRKNNIKNRLENYEELMSVYYKKNKEYDKGKDEKTDFGSDLFNLDIDYKRFFKINNIDNIVLENCLLSSYTNPRIDNKEIKETFHNLLIDVKKNYKLDMKTLNEIIFKNKSVDDLSVFIKYFSLQNNQQLSPDVFEYLRNFDHFLNNLLMTFEYIRVFTKNVTIIFKSIKEVKEFYCLLCVFRIIKDKKNFEEIEFPVPNRTPIKKSFPKKDLLENKIAPYYLKKKDEEKKDVCSVFNNYYTSDEELKLFGDYDNLKKEITFGNIMFNAEYQFNDPWEIILK